MSDQATRPITMQVRGDTLTAIVRRGEEQSLTIGRAALSLIEDALVDGHVPHTLAKLVNLEDVATDDLVDELVGRLQKIVDYDTLLARAEAAEARLRTIASAMGAGK